MTVNIEIKGNLAKLLATENLLIEHKKVDTASFDVERRVLTLPQWKIDSDYVYDMLVAHEVGHALHTPNRNFTIEEKYKGLPFDYVNVVEDARIEKLMKQRFAGLNKDFYKGYEELHAIDFFQIENQEINDLKLIDRVNLYFKVGAYLCIDFTDEENQLITEISQAETFDEVLDLSLKMYKMGKEQKETIEQLLSSKLGQEGMNGIPMNMDSDSNNDSNETQDDENGQVQTPSNDAENGEESTVSNKSQGETPVEDEDLDEETHGLQKKAGNHNDLDVSSTQKSFDGNVQSLNNQDARETNYVTIPELNLDTVEVTFDVIKNALHKHFIDKDEEQDTNSEKYFTEQVDIQLTRYNEHKNKSRKDVNNLVKEFEMKKSADSYSRQATARTGMLDMNKLHTYKYNEDIFKKVTTIPEGKNHGLMFLLDWSGSMHYQLNDTVKQLFNLVWFCRKVSIPFEVYAFTNDSHRLNPHTRIDERGYETYETHQIEKMGDLFVEGSFRMVNILSSTQRGRDLDDMMKLLWLQTHAISGHYYRPLSNFNLSGTPLNEAIIASGQIIKRLIKRESLQKCHCVILTDGEGFHSNHLTYGSNWDGEKRVVDTSRTVARSVCPQETIIRQGTKTFTGGQNESEFTCALVKAIKADLPNVSFLGIRILERDYFSFYMRYARKAFDTFEEMKKQNKKNGLIDFTTDTFDHWFCLSSNKLQASDELEVKEGAVKRDISTAFKRMNRGKKTNRVMVRQFIDQIA